MLHRRLLLTAAASLALAACNQKPAGPVTGAPIASLPLAEAVPPPAVAAPVAAALPPAPPLRHLARARRPVYAYVDDAYRLTDAFADSPPDYTVDYEGEHPWVWRAADGEYRVIEETREGEREYFYRGDSDYPFLVRDSRYAYAYDDGGLVEVYDSYGRPYPNYAPSLVEIAARYLFRARHLHYAAIHERRQAAYAGDWRTRRDAVLAPQRQWASEQLRNPDWRRLHEERSRTLPPQQQEIWRQERTQRQAYVSRVAPVIAAAPPPSRDVSVDRAQFEAPRRQPTDIVARDRQERQARADAAQSLQIDTQQREAQVHARAQAEAEARDQQRAQAEAGRAGREAEHQQRALAAAQSQSAANLAQHEQQRLQADAANHARDETRRRDFAQAHEQQRVQAEAENRARDDAQRQQQMQARDQQRAQAEASNHAREDEMRRQQAQARDRQHAQAEVINHAQDDARREQQAHEQQAHEQQRAQAEANHVRDEAQRQQQAQAHEQQRAQAEAANHAREEAARQAQAAQQQQRQQAQAAAQQQRQTEVTAQKAHPPHGAHGGGPREDEKGLEQKK